MKKIFIALFVFLLIGLVSAAVYQQPWISNQDGDQHNLTNMYNISTSNLAVNDFSASNFSGALNWTYLWNYPSACPAGSAVTTIGDSTTCSDLWIDSAGDNVTGNLDFNGNNISNLTLVNSTNLIALNLESNLDGTGFDITSRWVNATTLNATGNIISGGNLTLGQKITFAFTQTIDNIVDGWITITGNLDVTGNITGNYYYGEMWIHNETGIVTTSIASQSVWYNLTGFNNTDVIRGQSLNGFVYNNSFEHLTALVAGKYKASYSVSKGNAGNNQEYQFAVAINNIIQNNTVIHRKL